jgi:opacity protein-like surface antigen
MKRACVLAVLAAAALHAIAAADATQVARPLRDPFVRPAPPPAPRPTDDASEPPPLHLHAVILHGDRSLANIDGDIVGPGEQARDYTVLRIDARGVLVMRGKKQTLLTVFAKDKP